MVKTMKRQMRYARALAVRSDFVKGLSSLLTIVDEPRRPQKRAPMDALRGDFVKIGTDMHRAVDREHAREKARRKAADAAE